jgi:hypothetical protein
MNAKMRCMNKFDTYIYINSILIDDGDTKGNPKNAFILCHHICHFIISCLHIYRRRRRNKPGKKNNDEQTMSVTYRHITYAHSAYYHKWDLFILKAQSPNKEENKKHIVLCLSTDAGRCKRERERNIYIYISARYIPLYSLCCAGITAASVGSRI